MVEYTALLRMESEMELQDFSSIFEEGVGDVVVGVGAKVVETIKKIYAQMVAFAQEIGTSISTMCLQAKLDKKMKELEKKVASGDKVECPDFDFIIKEFRKDVNVLRREVQSIGRMLNGINAKNPSRLEKYMNRKDQLENDIIAISEDFQELCKKRIQIDPGKGKEEASRAVHMARLLVAEYTKLTRDIQKLSIQFEKTIRFEEASYETRIMTNAVTGPLHRIQVASTKCLRNGVFAICSFII